MLKRLGDFFLGIPEELDKAFQWLDLRLHRIDPKHRRGRPFLAGYSTNALWLPLVVIVLVAYGPLVLVFDHWRGAGLFGLCVAVLALYVVACRFARKQWLPFALWLLLLAQMLVLWRLAGRDIGKQADPAPYFHAWAVLTVFVLTLAVVFGWLFAKWFFGRLRSKYSLFARHLHETPLIPDDTQVPRRLMGIVRSFLMVPAFSPILLTLFPSMATLVAHPDWVWPLLLLTLGVAWIVLAAVFYHERLMALRNLLIQVFLMGGSGLVSTGIIILAVTRLAGVDYVTTVLDQGGKDVLVTLLVTLYFIFWLYGYWQQRGLAEALLSLLHDNEPSTTEIPLPGQGEGARLQLHGAGRFLAIGPDDQPGRPRPYRPIEVFRAIQQQLERRARAATDLTERQELWQEAERADEKVDSLEQRIRLLHLAPIALLFLVLGMSVLNAFHIEQQPGLGPTIGRSSGPDASGVTGSNAAGAKPVHFDLCPRFDQTTPVYAVAASGGGTRAALYTYSLLKALHDRRELDNIAVLSGVSGGSVGIAYFAAHYDALRAGDKDAWEGYREAMAAGYIRDVLAGIGEWRLAHGWRFGHLLSESLGRGFFGDDNPATGCPGRNDTVRTTLGDVAAGGGPGLIFNTSVVGEWNAKSENALQCFDERGLVRECATKETGGSRLVLTNLAPAACEFRSPLRTDCPDQPAKPGAWDLDFEYVVWREPRTCLNTAASLSANFPPIFSNAAVAMGSGETADRYWVTDGGAVENRGLISLLLALRDELRDCDTARELPPIKILVAEASGTSVAYREDRGIGAAAGSATKIANKLIAELAGQLQTTHGSQIEIVYLPMPTVLRRDFGTHWMMPDSICVSDPRTWYLPVKRLRQPLTWFKKTEEVTLDTDQILRLVDSLFAKDRRAASQLPAKLWDWIEAVPETDPRAVLIEALGPAPGNG